MNRLTKDLKTPHNNTTCSDVVKDAIDREDIVLTKLKVYEDLEEELGCPLEVLVKALKEGIYCVDYDNQKIRKFNAPLCLNTTSKQLYWYGNNIGFPDLKDYQKTWWLPGEKNEKEK